jgi:hypothetical protein
MSGEPGREQMLAIITDRQLGLDWMTPHEWDAYATWFELLS